MEKGQRQPPKQQRQTPTIKKTGSKKEVAIVVDNDEDESDFAHGDVHDERPDSKWAEYKLYVEHYRYYLDMTLKANGFFYLTAGGIAGYYLQHSTEPQMKYFLWLPMVAGLVLSGMFFYGAQLWERAYKVGMHIVEGLEKADPKFKELPDLHLLYLYLRFSGALFFIDGMILFLVPLLRSDTRPTEWRLPVWILVSLVLHISSLFIPKYCHWDNRKLQQRLKNAGAIKQDGAPPKQNLFARFINWVSWKRDSASSEDSIRKEKDESKKDAEVSKTHESDKPPAKSRAN